MISLVSIANTQMGFIHLHLHLRLFLEPGSMTFSFFIPKTYLINSLKFFNFWRRSHIKLWSSGTLMNFHAKNMTCAVDQHRTKSPRKLLNWSWSTSVVVPWAVQALLISHLSWILWRSPFSDSFKMAVDMSIAKGQSRGKAWWSMKNITMLL